MAAVTICSDSGAQENKVCHCFHFFPIYLPWSDRNGCHDLSFLNVEFQASFSLSSLTLIKGLFSSSSLYAIEWYHLHIWGCWYFSQQLWFQLLSTLFTREIPQLTLVYIRVSQTLQYWRFREFPGGSVELHYTYTAEGPGAIPSQGTKILQALRCGPKREKNGNFRLGSFWLSCVL